MCFGGSPALPPTPAPAPQQAQGNMVQAQQQAMQRQRAAASNTQLTGPQGITPKQFSGKTLLGV